MKVQAVIAFGLLACILYGLGAGLRSDIGILLMPLATHCGIAYEDVSFCIAVMQIVFGATQPFLAFWPCVVPTASSCFWERSCWD